MALQHLDESVFPSALRTIESWRLVLEKRGVTDQRLREFPFKEVTAHYRKHGKLSIDVGWVDELLRIQSIIQIRASHSDSFISQFLNTLFDILLDQHHGNCNYFTYTAVPIFELVQQYLAEYEPGEFEICCEVQVTLMVAMLSEMIRFELQSHSKTAASHQRIYFSLCALKAFGTMPCQISLSPSVDEAIHLWKLEAQSDPSFLTNSSQLALTIVEEVLLQAGPEVRLSLEMSLFPIHNSHDEAIFIRVTQLLERLLSMMVSGLQACVKAANAYHFQLAANHFRKINRLLLLSNTFIQIHNTLGKFESQDGVSKQQSKQFKRMNQLCAQPESSRSISMHNIIHHLLQDPTILSKVSFLKMIEEMRLLDRTYANWKSSLSLPVEKPLFPFLAKKPSRTV